MSDRLREAVAMAGSIVSAALDPGMSALIIVIDDELGAADVGGVGVERDRAVELLVQIADVMRERLT